MSPIPTQYRSVKVIREKSMRVETLQVQRLYMGCK